MVYERVGLMFAGQGAQAPGMGRDLYDSSAAAKAVFDTADRVLSRDLSGLCFEGSAEDLTASANCQPAIYTVSLACLQAWREQGGPEPVVTGGLSLGEFAALTAAGALALEPGLQLVARRGRLMDEVCARTDGGMAAVIGADEALVSAMCAEAGVDVANLNCPGQIVISGETSRLDAAMTALGKAGVTRIIPLQVAGAYHSRLMADAAAEFAQVLAATPITAPRCPVVQNVVGHAVTDPADIRRNLERQVTGSVLWEHCVRAMMDTGADLLAELGPGKVLSGFMRRIDRRFPILNVATAADASRLPDKLAGPA